MKISSQASLPVPAISAPWRLVLAVAGGSLLLAASAQIQVPFWPVPMTMQVTAVFPLAALAGGRLAAVMILAYLAEGGMGLPVFAGGAAGPAALLGPTGGYLVGFAVAALAVGEWIRRARPRGVVGLVLPMAAGLALVYLCGALWLSRFVGWPAVLPAGVLPFLGGDIVKVLLAAGVATALRRGGKGA